MQARQVVEDGRGQRGEHARAGGGLQHGVAGPQVGGEENGAGERQGRRELVEGDLVLGAVGVGRLQRGDALDHAEQVRGRSGGVAHGRTPLAQEQHRGGLGRVVAELGVPRAAGGIGAPPGVAHRGRDGGGREAVAGREHAGELAGGVGQRPARFDGGRGKGVGRRGGAVVGEVEQGSGFGRGHVVSPQAVGGDAPRMARGVRRRATAGAKRRPPGSPCATPGRGQRSGRSAAARRSAAKGGARWRQGRRTGKAGGAWRGVEKAGPARLPWRPGRRIPRRPWRARRSLRR